MTPWLDQFLEIGTALGMVAVGAVFAVLALRIPINSIRMWQHAMASKKWPRAEGQVIQAEIRFAGVRAPSARPHIRYGYRANGAEHVGSRIIFEGAATYTRQEAEEIIARYPAGCSVSVYYDPDKPSESTLETRHVGIGLGLVLGGILICSISFICLVPGLMGLWEIFAR